MTNKENCKNYIKKGIAFTLATAAGFFFFECSRPVIQKSQDQSVKKIFLPEEKIQTTQEDIPKFSPLPEKIKDSELEKLVVHSPETQRRLEILEKKVDEIPKAPEYKLSRFHCAEYAVRAAKDLYRKEFVSSNAFNLRYCNKVISEIENPNQIYQLIDNGILKPGMIVGTTNPNSPYRNAADQSGQKAEYTHVVVYVGKNKDQEPEFIHQRESTIENVTLTQLLNMRLTPVEVLDTRE